MAFQTGVVILLVLSACCSLGTCSSFSAIKDALEKSTAGLGGTGGGSLHLKASREETAGESPAPASLDDFTYYENTYYRGPKVLQSSSADSEVDCLSACAQDDKCMLWTYCPAKAGCEVATYCDPEEDAGTKTLREGTCILSYSEEAGYHYMMASGPGVAWVGGYRNTTDGTEGGGDEPSDSPSPDPEPSPSPEEESPAPSPPSGKRCVADENSFYADPDNQAEVVGGEPGVETAADCCKLCSEEPKCTVWSWCDIDAETCNFEVESGSGGSQTIDFEGEVLPGACALWDLDLNTAVRVAEGPAVPWTFGYIE